MRRSFAVLAVLATVSVVMLLSMSTSSISFLKHAQSTGRTQIGTTEGNAANSAAQWWSQPLDSANPILEQGEIIEPVEPVEYEPGQGPAVDGRWTFNTWGVGESSWSWTAPDNVTQLIFNYDLSKAEEQVKITRMTERLFSNTFEFRRTAQYSFKHKSHYQDKWQLNNTNDIGHVSFPPSFTIDRPEVTERGVLTLSNETFKEFKFNTPRSYFKTYSYSTDVTVDAFSCAKATISANLRSFRVPFNLTIIIANKPERQTTGIYLLKTASDLDIQQVPTPCPQREAAQEYEPEARGYY
jgi:hypothetical protein